MSEWWTALDAANRWFYVVAAFFGVIFLWQLIAALIGMAGSHDMDVGHDVAMDHDVGADLAHGEFQDFQEGALTDSHATVVAFKLLSIRSLLAFCTLFTWAAALYMDVGAVESVTRVLVYSTLWGLAGMIPVALLFHLMLKMTEHGTQRIATCVGTEGTVYMNIPAGGEGQVRATVSGVVSYVRARAAGGQALGAGAVVRIRRALNPTTVEVEPLKDSGEA